MRRFLPQWLALAVLILPAPVASAKVAAKHAVLISVDGLRADAVTQELMPRLSRYMKAGAWASKARCASPSVTIPNHVSMLTGLDPAKHGFLKNTNEDYPPGTHVPGTILEAAHASGRTTGLYVSKEKLRILGRPALLNKEVVTQTGKSDEGVAAYLADLAASGGWDLTVLHLVEPDFAGHKSGWKSPAYRDGVQRVDGFIGQIMDALQQRGLLAQTLVIITADHGGISHNHQLNTPGVWRIPWIAMGPPELAGRRLAERVGPTDIAPAILSALGLPIPGNMKQSSVLDEEPAVR